MLLLLALSSSCPLKVQRALERWTGVGGSESTVRSMAQASPETARDLLEEEDRDPLEEEDRDPLRERRPRPVEVSTVATVPASFWRVTRATEEETAEKTRREQDSHILVGVVGGREREPRERASRERESLNQSIDNSIQ